MRYATSSLLTNLMISVAILVGLFFLTPAQATPVTFTWHTTDVTNPNAEQGQLPDSNFSSFSGSKLTFTDAIVASGSYSFSEVCPDPSNPSSCPALSSRNFNGLQIDIGGIQPLNEGMKSLDALLNFVDTGEGLILTGHINYADLGSYFNFASIPNPNPIGDPNYAEGFHWSGTYNSDSLLCGHDTGTGVFQCEVAGYWDTPEPITLSIFGAGLIGAVAMRRRQKPA